MGEIHYASLSSSPGSSLPLSGYPRIKLWSKGTFWTPLQVKLLKANQMRLCLHLDPQDGELLGVLRAWVQPSLFRLYLASAFSTSSSSSHSMLTFCQAISLLALNFCLGEKKDEISAWRAGRGKTAAFNKMGWRREAQHLDQGGTAEVWEDTQLAHTQVRHAHRPLANGALSRRL